MPRETFAQTRARLFTYLDSQGWTMSKPDLKVPHATSPNRRIRVWFKTQAVYVSTGSGMSDFGSARSLHHDARELTGPRLVAEAERWAL